MKVVYLIMAVLNIFLFVYIADRTNTDIAGKAILSVLYFGLFIAWILEFATEFMTERKQMTDAEKEQQYREMITPRPKAKHWTRYL